MSHNESFSLEMLRDGTGAGGPRPGPPQEPHPHHHDDPGHEPAAPGAKGPFEQTITAALSLYVFNRP